MMRPVILGTLALALMSCAGQPQEAALTSAEFVGADDVETAALLLAIAEDGGSPASQRRIEAVRVLDGLGVKHDQGENPLATWRAQLPPGGPPLRGRMLGPAYRSGTLRPGEALETDQLFEGGRPAKVTFSAAMQAPLTVRIADGTAREVCRTDPSNPCSCRWTPPFSGRYSIRAENKGKESVRYFMVIG
jgi:hypothetical protein